MRLPPWRTGIGPRDVRCEVCGYWCNEEEICCTPTEEEETENVED